MAERGQLGFQASMGLSSRSPKGVLCENPAFGVDKRSRKVQNKSGGHRQSFDSNGASLSQLPFSVPPRRAQRKRTGTTKSSRLSSDSSSGARVQNPVKVRLELRKAELTVRKVKRQEWFDSHFVKYLPRSVVSGSRSDDRRLGHSLLHRMPWAVCMDSNLQRRLYRFGHGFVRVEKSLMQYQSDNVFGVGLIVSFGQVLRGVSVVWKAGLKGCMGDHPGGHPPFPAGKPYDRVCRYLSKGEYIPHWTSVENPTIAQYQWSYVTFRRHGLTSV